MVHYSNSLFAIYDIYVVPASYGCSSKLRGHGLQSLASTALSPAFSPTLSNSHHYLADVLDAEGSKRIHYLPAFTVEIRYELSFPNARICICTVVERLARLPIYSDGSVASMRSHMNDSFP